MSSLADQHPRPGRSGPRAWFIPTSSPPDSPAVPSRDDGPTEPWPRMIGVSSTISSTTVEAPRMPLTGTTRVRSDAALSGALAKSPMSGEHAEAFRAALGGAAGRDAGHLSSCWRADGAAAPARAYSAYRVWFLGVVPRAHRTATTRPARWPAARVRAGVSGHEILNADGQVPERWRPAELNADGQRICPTRS